VSVTLKQRMRSQVIGAGLTDVVLLDEGPPAKRPDTRAGQPRKPIDSSSVARARTRQEACRGWPSAKSGRLNRRYAPPLEARRRRAPVALAIVRLGELVRRALLVQPARERPFGIGQQAEDRVEALSGSPGCRRWLDAKEAVWLSLQCALTRCPPKLAAKGQAANR
jgi:hypothetical protein